MTQKKNVRLLALLVAIAFSMVGVAYAAVPLYQLFCQVTGYGGTTQTAVADTPTIPVLDREIRIRFTGNVTPGLDWDFHPRENIQTLKIGEQGLAFYDAGNRSTTRRITGTATYNVTPHKAGPYFIKVQCFCFTEQVLEPGQSAEMGVNFYVDPEIANDPGLDDVKEITLSYTFFLAGSEEVTQATKVGTVRPADGD